MKISTLHRFLLCAFVATALSLAAHAQTQAGQILAAKVEGEVLKIAADGTTAPLSNGAKIAETDTITTGKNSSVVLVFMNGSSVKLGADSRLAIDEFKMDPLGEDLEVSKLQAEPTVSQTKLNLSYGEMVGDVKKLNTSSNYSIKTPVGAAGIRGTIYRIVFRPTSDGKAFFTVSTAAGLVVMTGVTEQEIPIPVDKEVVVEIDVPETPGETAAPPVVVTQDIPAETKTLIQTESQTITQTVQETTFTPPPPTTPDPTPPSEPQPETKTEPEPPKETTPPVQAVTPTTPPVTSGAGL